MYMHANASKGEMKDRFLALDGTEMHLTLADQPVTIYFTDTYVADLSVVIEVDDQDGSLSSPAPTGLSYRDVSRNEPRRKLGLLLIR